MKIVIIGALGGALAAGALYIYQFNPGHIGWWIGYFGPFIIAGALVGLLGWGAYRLVRWSWRVNGGAVIGVGVLLVITGFLVFVIVNRPNPYGMHP
jgi:hypothetical protein